MHKGTYCLSTHRTLSRCRSTFAFAHRPQHFSLPCSASCTALRRYPKCLKMPNRYNGLTDIPMPPPPLRRKPRIARLRSAPKCHLLESLPPELRLRIYEFVYSEPCYCSLVMRSKSKLELFSRPASATNSMLRTCRTMYAEAAPVLYAAAVFRVHIHPEEDYHNVVPREVLGLPLERIRHVELDVYFKSGHHTGPVLQALRYLTAKLDTPEAELESLQARLALSQYIGRQSGPAIGVSLVRLQAEQLRQGNACLFQKILDSSSVVKWS